VAFLSGATAGVGGVGFVGIGGRVGGLAGARTSVFTVRKPNKSSVPDSAVDDVDLSEDGFEDEDGGASSLLFFSRPEYLEST